MVHITETEPQADIRPDVGVTDRRRPGRLPIVDAGLIPLLRGQADPGPPLEPRGAGLGTRSIDVELIGGAVIALTLLGVGMALRFIL